MNLKLNYLYRDAGNYKVYGDVILSNPDNISSSEFENKLREKLIDSEFFDPDEFKMPRLRHESFPYDLDLDHSWNEFDSVEETEEPTTDERTITEFLIEITHYSVL